MKDERTIHDLLDDAADALARSPGHEDLVRDLRSNATSMRQAWETFFVDAAVGTAFGGALREADANADKGGDRGWPLVAPDDDGIRPAGSPDRCFYCRVQVGEAHGADCVRVKKRVRLRYSFVLDVDVPHAWDEAQILFFRNEGHWCADDALGELKESVAGEEECLCSRFECSFESVVDATPRAATRPEEVEDPHPGEDATP